MFLARNVYYSTIALVAVLSFFLGAVFYRIMVRYPFGKGPVTGREALIGLYGTVTSVKDRGATVRVDSQYWRAKTRGEMIRIGDRVVVDGVENLTLIVKLDDQQV